MVKPAILTVDDDPEVLQAVSRDLRHQYGPSEGLSTVLIEREAPGGQAGTSSRIENYLGFPVGLSGSDLARRGVTQARRFGVEILTPQVVTKVKLQDPYRVLQLGDGSEISCHALLVGDFQVKKYSIAIVHC